MLDKTFRLFVNQKVFSSPILVASKSIKMSTVANALSIQGERRVGEHLDPPPVEADQRVRTSILRVVPVLGALP